MALTLWDHALLVKLYYQRNENNNAALREIRGLKKLGKRPMSIANLRKMIQRFETTGTLAWQPGQWHKVTSQQQVEEVAIATVEQEMENVQGTSSARTVSWHCAYPILNGEADPASDATVLSVQNLFCSRIAPKLCDNPIGFSTDILGTHANLSYIDVADFMEWWSALSFQRWN